MIDRVFSELAMYIYLAPCFKEGSEIMNLVRKMTNFSSATLCGWAVVRHVNLINFGLLHSDDSM